MAGALELRSPVALLEDAAHLLRRASLNDLLCHWIGSAPLALFLLVFWEETTHPPVTDLVCAAQALAAALLLVWMSCWRSVFAGRLLAGLSGGPQTRWDRPRIWSLIVGQAFAAATKPIVLPLALIAVFPFPAMVSFYRNASVLAGRGELDPVAVLTKARRLGRGDAVQTWVLQLLLLLLAVATLLNVAVTFLVLPQLLRMLTGFESAFTRSGSGFFENRLFLFSVLAATWLVFDPFVQAVYAVRCFERESVETGEDVRSALRRMRPAAAALLLLAFAAPARAADAVSTADLERAVRQAMEAPEYNWRIPPPPEAVTSTPWIVRATDRGVKAVQSAMRWVGRMIDRLIRWLFGSPELSPMPVGGRTPGRGLHWSVWAGVLLALAMAGWVFARVLGSRRGRGAAARPAAPAVRLEDDALTADRLPEDEWLQMAERCLADGNRRLAVRAFYLANLAWLGRERYLTIQPGRTNREFEVELRRRARHSPEAREAFSENVRAFERAWYGMYPVGEDDAAEFRRRAEGMKARLRPEVAA